MCICQSTFKLHGASSWQDAHGVLHAHARSVEEASRVAESCAAEDFFPCTFPNSVIYYANHNHFKEAMSSRISLPMGPSINDNTHQGEGVKHFLTMCDEGGGGVEIVTSHNSSTT